MPAATGGKPGRADSGCEMSDGREAVEIKPNVRLRNGAGGGLNEKTGERRSGRQRTVRKSRSFFNFIFNFNQGKKKWEILTGRRGRRPPTTF